MIKTTVTFDGKQIFFNLPDKPSVELIFKSVKEYLPKSLDFNRNVIQLFDPTIREFFDLNDEGLRSWLALPMKEKNQMRLKIIPATIDGNQTQIQTSNDPMNNVFEKIQQDIDFLFTAIENLQLTAKGIRNDFQIAFEKYQNSVNCNRNGAVSNESADRRNGEKEIHATPVHFAAEDIRYKNETRCENIVSIPLVSAAYQEDEERSDDDRTESSVAPIDIEIPLLNVGEDFQALVSIAVNPSYFFIQNTFHTHDLERLAESMNEYYSNSETPSKSFRPATMSCCAARYSVDDRWYRARVKRYNSDDTVEIVYLDYGNNEERPLTELRPLNSAFTRLPAQAICAALELLPMNNDNPSSWTKKASYKFHEDTLGKPLDVRIIAQPTLQWPMYFVQLTIDEHTDVAETLISLRLAQRASLPEIIRGIGPRLDLTDYAAYNLAKEIADQIIKKPVMQSIKQASKPKMITTLSNRISRTAKTLPELEYHLENHIGSCTITSIISPSEFFIQFTEKNQFEHLYTAVHETYLQRISCDRVARLKITNVDGIGVARNPRDQRFYRVQIIKHDRERKTLHLLCVDIGEYLTVPDSSIYELLPEYEQYPAQAVRCCLGLISSVTADWSRESIHFIHRQIGTRGFKSFRFYGLCASAGSFKLSDPPLPIILYDPNLTASSINEQLVDKKLALPNPEYLHTINMAKELMNDVNGYKNQRILQYIESQRNFTDSSDNNPRTKETISVVEDDDNAPYCPPVIDPESRHWYAVEVTHVKTPGEFFIRFPFGIDNTLGQGREPAPYPEEIQANRMLKDLHRSMAEFYSNEPRRGISTALAYDVGQMVAVRYQSQWHRARVLEFKSATNFAWLEFVDQGETRELGTNTMRPLHARFLDLPLQAYLSKLEGFDSNYSWTSQDKDLFKKKVRDKIIYAKKVREPNFIQLVDLVDGEVVSFEALWRTLHQSQQKTLNSNTRAAPSTMGRTTNDSLSIPGATIKSEPVVHHLQPIFHGISQYASESEHSNLSSVLKRPSGATIPPPPPTNQNVRMPMQFVSAGFKQPSEYGHLSPDQLLAQVQQQESHRIQSNNGYSIRKLQRNQ